MLNLLSPSRTRAKICGITTLEDAHAAVQAGADALGFVFYPKSPRAVSLEQAIGISQSLPAFVSTVALVVDAEEALIHAICQQMRPTLLQFHGNESPEACESWKYPYIKALRMKPDLNVASSISSFAQHLCKGILLDAYHPGIPGGTGESFDWARIPPLEERALPLILAGGLNDETIENAIRSVQPWAVDVSSGVEYAPGRKCPTMMRAFIQGVLNAALPLPR
ncbi:MAG: phosphoribosylanthranilate isomerase [Pseudomonadota bacterium]